MTRDLRRAHGVSELERIAAVIRDDVVTVLADIGHEHRGHPGAALSIVDIVTVLYFRMMRIDPSRPDWPDRDRFVLSKGHGCMALYAALARRGFFDPAHLRTFRSVDSILQGHPDMRKTPGVDMTSGSLGHGLSAGIGMALDARIRRSPAHVDVLLGDGELQEGLVWEAAMSGAKYALSNVTAYVDCNGLQSGGRVADVMPIEPLAAKWRAFGWRVLQIDGHDMRQILRAASTARRSRKPSVVLARTVKGKGVPYMENDNRWHQACPPGARAPDAAPSPGGARLASTRAAFGRTVRALGRQRPDIVVVTSDTCASMGLDGFSTEFPDRHIEVGIAEQNLVTVAAGLAAGERTVFVATYGTFASMRALEQLRTFVAYPRLRVAVVAGLGGLTGGIEGVAHLAVEDVGILRCIPGLHIFTPADAIATEQAVRAAANLDGPSYIRLGRDDSPVLFDTTYALKVGCGNVIATYGTDAALLTFGLMTAEVVAAAQILSKAGVACTVAEFPTMKPLDSSLIRRLCAQSEAVFTIEEHSRIGGLGTAVMEVLSEAAPARVTRIGLDDAFLQSGTPAELRRKYGLTAEAIAGRVLGGINARAGSSRVQQRARTRRTPRRQSPSQWQVRGSK